MFASVAMTGKQKDRWYDRYENPIGQRGNSVPV